MPIPQLNEERKDHMEQRHDLPVFPRNEDESKEDHKEQSSQRIGGVENQSHDLNHQDIVSQETKLGRLIK